MSEAVRVMVRVRPMNQKEKDRGTDHPNARMRERGGHRHEKQVYLSKKGR